MNKAVVKKIKKLEEYKGINLKFDGEVNMAAPCWEGYTQYGMKDKDGVLVPNCVKD